MGWWSATVMGGDAPLDCQGDLIEILGIDFDESLKMENRGITRQLIEKNLKKIKKWLAGMKEDREIAYQVVAFHVLATGADVGKRLLKQLIDNAQDPEVESWCDPDERRFYMDDLKKALQGHKPGKVTKLKQEGLFQKIFEKAGGA